MPEARINLAQATIHLAVAPKSNAVITRDRRAPSRTCRPARSGRCRLTCATPTTAGAKDLGHGKGYAYPHDEPTASPSSSTSRTCSVDASYYKPTALGAEAGVKERWERVRRIVRGG